jgi:NAD(P)H-hydrate epimerase
MEDADAQLLPAPKRDVHKWSSAVAIVAGSPGMEGAAALASHGAARAGAGMVRLCVPGSDLGDGTTLPGPWPLEAVRIPIPRAGWAAAVLNVAERCRALVIGPGLGRADATGAAVREVIARSPVPVVADADALAALGGTAGIAELAAGRPMVITPHAGEYAKLTGHPPGPDRVVAARELAERTGVVALVKGSLTAVALPPAGRTDPGPGVLLTNAGSPRLGTAGTGDVLSGIIGAFMARGMDVGTAAALAAHVHGRAASLSPGLGMVAGDLPDLVLDWLAGQGAA